jgi:membrane protein DedA with SNARE-associated domain
VTITEFLARFGYVAVVLGTALEGETVLIMAGFAAHQVYLALPWVIVAAFCGSLCADQLAFFAGRRYGPRLVARYAGLARAVAKATGLLERYGTALLVGFRFVYGIRIATPLTAGMSGVSVERFATLNAIGAALWALAVGSAGYFFGHGFELALDRARRFEEHALWFLLGVGALVTALHFALRSRRRGRSDSVHPERP